jgi:hypothetical protein
LGDLPPDFGWQNIVLHRLFKNSLRVFLETILKNGAVWTPFFSAGKTSKPLRMTIFEQISLCLRARFY